MPYRLFAPHPLTTGEPITLSPEETHHLTRVLRIKQGEEIELVNGAGTLATAVYAPSIVVQTSQTFPPPTGKRILIQAIPEPKHLEFILEKGTELGITDFWLFPAQKSPMRELSDSKTKRAHSILISALKQCKRLYLPALSSFPSPDKIKSPPPHLFLADPKGSPYPKNGIPSADIGIIVGPEGGLTSTEIDLFTQKLKAIPITLSFNVLRAETAAIVASAFISQLS